MNNLRKAINELKKEKNAIILGHYYQADEIQEIADFIGDSLALAQWAAKTDAKIIVMCGVHFMGETAKILCPDKKVLIPDLNAGCSLADSCPADKFAAFVKDHPGYKVISYVNTSAAVKAVTDVVVTSTNARQIVESFPENEKLIFKIMKRGEKLKLDTAKTENDLTDSGLRYDLTVPLSRYYSNNAN